MRIVEGYLAFQPSVKPEGQVFCRVRRPDGGWNTHIGTYEEIMADLKERCPSGRLADLKEARS